MKPVTRLTMPTPPLAQRRTLRRQMLCQTALAGAVGLSGGLFMPGAAARADSLPVAPTVVAGSATIRTGGNEMTVNQSSHNAIVNWNSFSIGAGHGVTFVQPDTSSAILNRVNGSTASTIAGRLSGNGQIYLVNPNGIAITPSGKIKAGGGFVASSLDIGDDDFMAGRRTFSGTDRAGSVVNEGEIAVGSGGYAALLGRRVRNDGLVSVPLGRVGLGAGQQATLDVSGDGFLQVAVPDPTAGEDPLIVHNGRLSADGGRIVISAATAREAARQAVNIAGVTEAKSIGGRNGAISIGGGEGGKVSIRGKVDVSSGTGKGGSITVSGRDVALSGATLDASGREGGGAVRVGGNRKGAAGLQTAATTSVDAASVIRADATGSGTGGQIVIWSDLATNYAGTLSARGKGSGAGGEAEVSGKAGLDFIGAVDLSAESGVFGNLLLDPYNVTISSAASTNASGVTPTGNDSIINVATLQNALANANVTISTGSEGSAGNQAGDILVASDLMWNQGTRLTLSAYRNIALNANLSGGGGASVVLRADNAGTGTGTVTVAGDRRITADGGVSIYYNPAGKDAGSVNTDSYLNLPDFSGIGGTRTAVTAYALVNTIYDLQNVRNNKTANYALGRDIDAGVTHDWSSGFLSIGGNRTMGFSGTFDGLGHVITDLYIGRQPLMGYGSTGLFGLTANSALIRNIGLVDVEVEGNSSNDIGALVGAHYGRIENAYSTGSVTSDGIDILRAFNTGGLVGYLGGTIDNSYSTASVRSGTYVGGLVGYNAGGTISRSYATGPVSGQEVVGGLVGGNSLGAVSTSWATGTVRGDFLVGGLAGINVGGQITQSFATGDVRGTVDAVGGLVGKNYDGERDGVIYGGNISQSYARGSVAGGTKVGGLVGWNVATVTQSYATGSATGSQQVGGLVGLHSGSLAETYSAGEVQGNSEQGGLVGASNGGRVTSSYWDILGSSLSTSAGGVGLSRQAMQDNNSFTGFDGTVWAPASAGYAPELFGVSGVVGVRETAVYGDTPTASLYGSGVWNTLSGTYQGVGRTTGVGSYDIDLTGMQGQFRGGGSTRFVSLGATVTPRTIVIAANNQTRDVGATNPPLSYSVGGMGLVNGDSLSGALATSASTGSGAGTYAITRGSLTASANYSLQFIGGTLTVRTVTLPPTTPPSGPPAPPPRVNTPSTSTLEQELSAQSTGLGQPSADQIVTDFIQQMANNQQSQAASSSQQSGTKTPDDVLGEVMLQVAAQMRAQALAESQQGRSQPIQQRPGADSSLQQSASVSFVQSIIQGIAGVVGMQLKQPPLNKLR
ncbi:GLUG motif-containing protein [Rhizobium straminoryzae]|uniref:Filamentous hemagglutinin N-terminal domain-containing protein n=1 Tax=Rhizobium straminoryzae TaxID=1387186 RepID=A0A549SPG3_9HYPH|nr:GLUG motif-containing protein [Rhizobium straminoryzae]TRL31504.1 filamentous hemagglutinin N-terminal domain-containing protein [Rhizobium straminoryzae]